MYAINSKRNRSEVIRAAIVNFLREEVKNEAVPTARVEKLTFQ
jgi:Arc/MetJ-type ribon-helix-helix transcriptional regulator